MGNEAEVVWELAAELGEGPVWVQRDEALWFVDIKQHQIHRYEPASGGKRSWEAPEEVGFILPAERGGFVVGLKSGLYHFDEMSDAFDLIVEVEPDKPNNRLNDGVVDPAGRLWFGTMDNEERAKSGAFYCFADNRLTPTGIDGIAITNGPAVSPDGRILYLVDTLKGTIEAAEHPRTTARSEDGGRLRKSTRRMVIPTGPRSTATATSGSRFTRDGRRFAIRQPAISSSAFASR